MVLDQIKPNEACLRSALFHLRDRLEVAVILPNQVPPTAATWGGRVSK